MKGMKENRFSENEQIAAKSTNLLKYDPPSGSCPPETLLPRVGFPCEDSVPFTHSDLAQRRFPLLLHLQVAGWTGPKVAARLLFGF